MAAADQGSDDAEQLVREAQSRIDRAVLKGVLHKNTAAHRKARLAKHLAAAGADALVIITEWDQFRALDLDRVKEVMKTPALIDLRNIYRPDDVRGRGIKYASIGRA